MHARQAATPSTRRQTMRHKRNTQQSDVEVAKVSEQQSQASQPVSRLGRLTPSLPLGLLRIVSNHITTGSVASCRELSQATDDDMQTCPNIRAPPRAMQKGLTCRPQRTLWGKRSKKRRVCDPGPQSAFDGGRARVSLKSPKQCTHNPSPFPPVPNASLPQKAYLYM